jgi:hypothetical protein
MKARWIRLGPVAPLDFDEACARLAAAQEGRCAPILAWGEGREDYPFALIVEKRLLPGRRFRWHSWALASAVATFRQFGAHAYLDGEAVWLHGVRIAACALAEAGECAVFASSFPRQLPTRLEPLSSRELEDAFRMRLEAQHGWQFDHCWPRGREIPRYAVA